MARIWSRDVASEFVRAADSGDPDLAHGFTESAQNMSEDIR